MRLKVLRLDEVVNGTDCEPPFLRPAVATENVFIPLQEGKVLDCPDLQDVAKMADSEPTVTWYHVLPKVHHDTTLQTQTRCHTVFKV